MTDLEICEFCGRKFKTLHGLKIHCGRVHLLEMELESVGWVVMEKCTDCGSKTHAQGACNWGANSGIAP